MGKMGVLMICENLPPIQGGIENHVHNLSIELANRCNIVLVSLTQPKGTKSYEKNGNLTIYRLPKRRFSFMRNISAIIKLAKTNNIHVIHAHTVGEANTITAITGKLLHKPTIVTVHESSFIINLTNPKTRRIRSLTYHIRLKSASAIIAPSSELRDYVKNGANIKDGVIEIANGVDLKRFNNNLLGDSTKAKYGLANHSVILCPRRIIPKNGIIYLIEAIPRVVAERPDVLFVFAGPVRDDIYFHTIQERIKSLDISKYVIFTGGIPYNQMPEIYIASDIVVIPSLIEAISLSALEAMACKKPIVATTVGGLPEIITNGQNGLLVEPASGDSLANAILLLLNNECLAKRYAENSALTVENYSWSVIAQKTYNVYVNSLKIS
jgi:glycosyltransferase involved in cell wall biosynthesis